MVLCCDGRATLSLDMLFLDGNVVLNAMFSGFTMFFMILLIHLDPEGLKVDSGKQIYSKAPRRKKKFLIR